LSFLLSQIVLPHVVTRQGAVPNHESFKVGQMKIVQNLSIYLSIHLATYLHTYLPTYLKRSYSARLPQFSKLTPSITKQFCETSWIFEVDNDAVLRHFLQFWSWKHQ
jgi:hypothetical protein